MDCGLPDFSVHEIFQARSGVSLPSPSFLLSFVILINSGDNTFISYVICNCFFSQPVVYFIFLTMSLKSISCHFFFFPLWIMLLMSNLRNLCVIQDYKAFFQCFLLKVLVLGFTFKAVIHFEIIFIYGKRYRSKVFCFLFLHVIYNCFSTACWKDHPLSTFALAGRFFTLSFWYSEKSPSHPVSFLENNIANLLQFILEILFAKMNTYVYILNPPNPFAHK